MADLLRQHLAERLDSLFRQHHVVVWHDDSGTLEALLREGLPRGVEMPAFQGNPLSVRSLADTEDPWLDRKWLLYIPELPDGVTCEWLGDHEQAFGALRQANLAWALGQVFRLPESPRLRTLLRGPVARSLANHFGEYFSGRETIEEGDVVLALLRAAIDAPASSPVDLVLRYLAAERDAGRWQANGLLPALTQMVKSRLGLQRHLIDGQPPDRGALARCLLASALVVAGAAEAKAMANHLPREDTRPQWADGLNRGLRDSALHDRLARALEQALQGSKLTEDLSDPVRLARGPALAVLDDRMRSLLLEMRAVGEDRPWWEVTLSVADERLGHEALDAGNWRQWTALRDAARLLIDVRRRSDELLEYPVAELDRLAHDYVRAGDGDWHVDALYRSIAHADAHVPSAWVAALLGPARDAYHRFVRDVTARFVQAVAACETYAAAQFTRQRLFWSEIVESRKARAVLIVDALRADLAHELGQRAQAQGHSVERRFALAELPTRTEVGMAALLPRAHQDFAVRVEQGRLVPSIEGKRVSGTDERVRYLEAVSAQQGIKVRRGEVGEFLRDDARLVKECSRAGVVPVAFTTDIDDAGETAARVTFQVFDEILDQCAGFVQASLAAGIEEVFVAGDHGFLVRDPDAAPSGIPGTAATGGALARGLRYAAGTGEMGRDLVRLPASWLGRRGDDVYVPRDTGCLAVPGGPGPFVHGGLSLQECALVFLRIRPGAPGTPARPTVRVQAPERVTALAFPIALVVEPTATPLLVAPVEVLVTVNDLTGVTVWEMETPVEMRAGTAAVEHRVVVALPRGGEYVISAVDVLARAVFDRRSVRVEVLGDDFTF
jgi:hypothetical protein